MSAQDAIEKLRARLGDFAGFGYRVAFDMGEDGVIAVDGTVTPATLEDEAGEPACTIRLSAANLEKLIAGQLNPMMAYTLGKLKIDGSMGVAMKVATLLEE